MVLAAVLAGTVLVLVSGASAHPDLNQAGYSASPQPVTGKSATGAAPLPAAKSASNSSSDNTGLIIGVIAAVVVVGSVGTVLFVRSRRLSGGTG
jgi:hypothetical protein